MAVGVVIGGAFGKIVSSVVSDVIMPPVGVLVGGVNFTDLKITLKDAVTDVAGNITTPEVTLNYGSFIQTIFDFIIIAFAIFLMVKAINSFHKKNTPPPAEPAPPAPSNEEVLRTEIRDLLKEKK